MKPCVLPLLLLLSACGKGDAGTFRDVRDSVEAATGVPLLGKGPCFRRLSTLDGRYTESMMETCYKLEPPQRWRGLWRNAFEGSRFCPAPAVECSNITGKGIWLDYAFGGPGTRSLQWKVAPGGLYAVDLIGRLTKVRGHYGHMGMSDQEMLVDRMISIKQLEPPPPEPTKAEMIAHFKKCEAAKTCVPNWQMINSTEE